MTPQKKLLFIIAISNTVDIITNSSSELFVLKGKTIDVIKEMISNIYPNYLHEYEEVKHIDELTNEELTRVILYYCTAHAWPHEKKDLPVLKGFKFNELYEREKDYQTKKLKPKAWNNSYQYTLKLDKTWRFVTDQNRGKVIKAIKEDIGEYFLYSLDENPDYEMQEKLELISKRFHLG